MDRFRTTLVTAVLAVTISAALASSASATAPTAVTQGAAYAQLAVDGNIVYGVDGRSVIRTDATTGLSRTVYTAQRGWAVDYMLAGGGYLGIQLSKTVKRRMVGTRAVFYNSTAGAARSLGSGAVSAKRKYKCGTEVAISDVTATGEAVVIRNSFSLSRKRCRKPVNASTQIRGVTWLGNRVLFSGNIRNSRTLASLGGVVLAADLNGEKLVMTGFGVGVFDLPTQQFVMIKPSGRSTFFIGTGDRNANALILGIPSRGSQVKYELLDAASGYSNSVPIETTSAPVSYMPCGDYLVRAQFAARRGAVTQLNVVANPLIPATVPNPDQLVPSGEILIDATCDGANVAFSTYRNGDTYNLWRAPLSG